MRLGVFIRINGTAVTADYYALNQDGSLAEFIRCRVEGTSSRLAATAVADEWRLAAETLGLDLLDAHPKRAAVAA